MDREAFFVFPGQGSQYIGMAREFLYDRGGFPKEIISRGAEIVQYETGRNIREIMFSGTADELNKTINAQPAIVLSSLAYRAALNEVGLKCVGVAGHSIGTYAALSVAGVLGFHDALRMTCQRAEAMSRCVKVQKAGGKNGIMAVVMAREDLDFQRIYDICSQSCQGDSCVDVANENAPTQIVLSGEENAVHRAVDEVERTVARIKSQQLDVEGPFHSRYMTEAARQVEAKLTGVDFYRVVMLYISDTLAKRISDEEDIRASLVAQITSPVKWNATLEAAVEHGFRTFIECGPGKVQTGLLKRFQKRLKGQGIDIEVLDKDELLK